MANGLTRVTVKNNVIITAQTVQYLHTQANLGSLEFH